MKALIVDDSSFVRRLVRKAIEGAGPAGISVVEAASAAEAVALFDAHRPAAVTLDLTLPDGDGLRVLATIRSRCASTAVVVVSSLAQEALRKEALRLGARAFVAKPFSLEELRRTIADLLAAAGAGAAP